MSIHSYYRKIMLVFSFHNFPPYPYQRFQLIIHPFHEVFTLSLAPSENLSAFNENMTNFTKLPLNLHSASLSLSLQELVTIQSIF